MNQVHFISDTHYSHKNIIRGTSDWVDKDKTRWFNTIEEHNTCLVNVINSKVREDDILYHLGDWSFGGFENISEFRKQLNCKTIHLILGNHDHHIENNRNRIQNLFESVQHYKEIIVHNQLIILSHYSMRVWNKLHKNSWMLYGHSHGTLPDIGGKTMDVGCDTNNLLPYSFEEIKQIMNKRINLEVDHHGKNTN